MSVASHRRGKGSLRPQSYDQLIVYENKREKLEMEEKESSVHKLSFTHTPTPRMLKSDCLRFTHCKFIVCKMIDPPPDK